MNKRHYEHTLPNIRGSLSNTYIDTKFQNCFYLGSREEKRSGMNAGQMPFHLLHTVTCHLRCFLCLPVSVVRMPDACQGLTRHG